MKQKNEPLSPSVHDLSIRQAALAMAVSTQSSTSSTPPTWLPPPQDRTYLSKTSGGLLNSTDSHIAEVVGEVVLLIMITLMNILKLIFGIKADLSKQADILQETLRQVKDLGKKNLGTSSDLLIKVHDNEDRVNDWLS